MATVTGNDWRVTYTMTTNPTNVVVTITQIERYSNYSGRTRMYPQTSQIFYYDESGSNVETGISIAGIEYTGIGWKTVWTGTKVVTSYRQIYVTSVSVIAGMIEVPVLPSFQVTYNTDGGSAAPDTQLKYLGKQLILARSKPTKTGYTFVNWRSSADGKIYGSGGVYTLDQATTMTAQWGVNTYTVTYNTNGGAGVANAQIKTYNEPLNFNDGSTIYKKETVNQITHEYELLHWNTNPDDSGDSYALGSDIPNITNPLTVYAIWELKYLHPFISNLQAYRTATSSISDKTRADRGEYIYISFDFVGCSDDAGSTYKVPDCKIQIDEDVYTPTLSFTTSPNGSLEFKAPTAYSYDNPHNIVIEVSDQDYSGSKYSAYDYITTGIYPIDLFDNGQLNEVYMGVMHPYVNGVPLTLTDTYVDGNVDVRLDVDPNASAVTPAISGEDKDLFNKIVDNGWYNDVIYDNNILMLKQWANKVSDNQSPGPGPTPTSSTYNEIFIDGVITGTSKENVAETALTNIVNNYYGYQNTVFKGTYELTFSGSTYTYHGWFEIFVLDTSDIDSTSGFPIEFSGTLITRLNEFIRIYPRSTNNGVRAGTLTIPSITTSAGYYCFTFENGFTYYATSGGNMPEAAKRAGMVTLSGAFTTTAAQSSGGMKKMATISASYRPHKEMHFLCQGSGVNRYLLYIYPNGEMYADRYGTTSEIAIPSGVWLNISCTYVGANV